MYYIRLHKVLGIITPADMYDFPTTPFLVLLILIIILDIEYLK